MKKILTVVGTRPNFVKIAPFHNALRKYSERVNHIVCHTGQHFDEKMSGVFLEELEMPKPDYNLGISGGSHAKQTAQIMMEFERVLHDEHPDLVVVPGDVNSTLACSLVAAKLGVKLAHIESGLRSFNREMPEEINRIVTDALADYLFVSEPSGIENLRKEGVPDDRIFYVGNIMIDSLTSFLDKIKNEQAHTSFGLKDRDYILVTFHRPSNVDNSGQLRKLVDFLSRLSRNENLIFPVHPRTRANIRNFGLGQFLDPKIKRTEPLGYVSFLSLVRNSKLIITDSGGIQEECTFLGIPCITVREDTERPVTVSEGTNYLAGTDVDRLDEIIYEALANPKKGQIPKYWDGNTAERIVEIILKPNRQNVQSRD
ncbi:MAG: UDP-N-acetylglucosamine 2-epimerase (non-hydrolyzing) [Cytophagales bacterium]|nr:UDP-N-acetylglucosamine 2-epimerase (non-hydrolyzing) [Cytophagales bacterium]